jgi:hypothetical protein
VPEVFVVMSSSRRSMEKLLDGFRSMFRARSRNRQLWWFCAGVTVATLAVGCAPQQGARYVKRASEGQAAAPVLVVALPSQTAFLYDRDRLIAASTCVTRRGIASGSESLSFHAQWRDSGRGMLIGSARLVISKAESDTLSRDYQLSVSGNRALLESLEKRTGVGGSDEMEVPNSMLEHIASVMEEGMPIVRIPTAHAIENPPRVRDYVLAAYLDRRPKPPPPGESVLARVLPLPPSVAVRRPVVPAPPRVAPRPNQLTERERDFLRRNPEIPSEYRPQLP